MDSLEVPHKPRFGFIKSLLKLGTRIIVSYAVISVCVFSTLLVIGGIYSLSQEDGTGNLSDQAYVYGNEDSHNTLLSLRITGVIDGQAPDAEADRLTDTTYGYDIKEDLYAAAKNPDIAGVILEIDSPGGTIYGAQAIADGVSYYRETAHKPVYAHVSGMAASGGYWAAASADKIVADLGSSIGSIGVIDGPYKYYDKVLSETDSQGSVITQNGIQSVTISAGTGKGLGDPYRKLTAAETESIQLSVNNDYNTFVDFVSRRRHIAADVIKGRLGALVYGTQTATTEKLIDATGGREAAYAQLAKAAKLDDDDYQVVRPEPATAEATTQDDPWAVAAHSLFGHRQAVTGKARSCTHTGIQAYYGDPAAACTR